MSAGSVSDAERIAAAVLAVPGVVGLHDGAFGEIATYLPGRRVPGVRIDPEGPAGRTGWSGGGSGRVEVYLVARYPEPIPALATTVRARLIRLVAGRAVDIYVEDYATGDAADEPPSAGLPPTVGR